MRWTAPRTTICVVGMWFPVSSARETDRTSHPPVASPGPTAAPAARTSTHTTRSGGGVSGFTCWRRPVMSSTCGATWRTKSTCAPCGAHTRSQASATLRCAEALGLAQDLGSLEAGKLADMVVLAKDPLQDIHNTNTIRYVMKNGELFEGDTLNQVWPREKPLAPLWWWNDKP